VTALLAEPLTLAPRVPLLLWPLLMPLLVPLPGAPITAVPLMTPLGRLPDRPLLALFAAVLALVEPVLFTVGEEVLAVMPLLPLLPLAVAVTPQLNWRSMKVLLTMLLTAWKEW
jgi:hypothetical protein